MSKPSIFPVEQTLPFPLVHDCTFAGLLQMMIESSPIAVVALDASHRFSIGNCAFHSMFGYPADALLHADFDEAITTLETRDEARQLSASVLQGQRVHANTKRRRSDGVVIQVEISGIPLIEGGRLAGVYGLYRCASSGDPVEQGRKPLQSTTKLPRRSAQEKTLMGTTEPLGNASTKLTEREQHLLRFLAEGRTSKVIAQELGISVRTVESHRSSINQKCGFRSVADLVRFTMLQQAGHLSSS